MSDEAAKPTRLRSPGPGTDDLLGRQMSLEFFVHPIFLVLVQFLARGAVTATFWTTWASLAAATCQLWLSTIVQPSLT